MSFQFQETTHDCNATEYFIAGIKVLAYHSSENSPLEEDGDGNKLNLLLLMHGRCQSARYIKALTKNILAEYKSNTPLVILNFDQRNHGERAVDKLRNKDWAEGNDYHAHDMLSIIDGNLADLKTVIEYMPCYFPKLSSYAVTKILSGVSLGGHSTIRFASQYSRLVDAIIPIVGCYDLTSLLLNRLFKYDESQLFQKLYSELRSNIEEFKYPEALFQKTSHDDSEIYNNFPVFDLKILSIHGEVDDCVFLEYSLSFFAKYNITVKQRDEFDPKTAQFQAIKYPTKHHVTDDMITDICNWLQHI